MKAFQPTPDMVLKNYFEVPVDVLEDDGELEAWARRAVDVQRRKHAARTSRKKRQEKSK
jgi:TfoX/Sxy family transcriptional regulator of competence genes